MAPGHLARLRLAKESKVGGAAASSQLPASPRQLLTRKRELHLACISHISISQILQNVFLRYCHQVSQLTVTHLEVCQAKVLLTPESSLQMVQI